MLSALWARITGKDKDLTVPDQQAVSLGRVGDYTVIFPYGMHCDLPSDALLRVISPGVAIPVTVKRPADGAQGEPMFFHPVTNTRIIARNNGDLDVFTTGNINQFIDGDANIQVAGDVVNDVGGDFTVNAANINLNATNNFNSTTGGSGQFSHNGTNIGDDHKHSGSPTAPSGIISDTGDPI